MLPFFKCAEQLFADYEIPENFQTKVINPINPFLSMKACTVLAKVSSDVTSNYESVKTAILREL